MAFNPITTQEDLDAIIETRLGRERATIAKKYADYDELKKTVETLTGENKTLKDYQKKTASCEKDLGDLRTQLDEANGKIKTFEQKELRTSVAMSKGLPMDLVGRLSGETKEEIEADADVLLGIFKTNNNTGLPLADLGGSEQNETGTRAALRETLKNIRNKQ